jgi:ArsR family transcriptional regulator
MVSAKTILFDSELQQRAELFKALAHPARLQILQYLSQSKCCLSGDISDIFPLARTTLNQHLQELKDAGLIVGHPNGCKICYCLNSEKLNQLKTLLEHFMREIDLPLDFCCQ